MNNIYARLLDDAQAIAELQQWPTACLYVLATPIGNLADISLRGLAALARADAIAAEDTRSAARLLQAYGIGSKPVLRCDAHAERDAQARVAERLARGERVLLISDAGTPAISDPGARLVDGLRGAGFRIVPLPGASAPTALLSVAGFDERCGHRFVGFAPRKDGERRAWVERWRASADHVLCFESPQRLPGLLQALAAGLQADRRVALGRELSKRFEQVQVLSAGELVRIVAEAGEHLQQGEWVLAIEALRPEARAEDEPALDPADRRWLEALARAAVPPSVAAQLAAAATGQPRQRLYRELLRLRPVPPGDPSEPTE